MAQNVGTAKVTIEADFSTFEKDMASYFGKAGDEAGDALDKGVKQGTDKAADSLSDVADAAQDAAKDAGESFGTVGKEAGKAGQDASKQFGSGVEGVSKSADQATESASKSFSGVAGAASRAGADAGKGFSVGITGVSTSTSEAVGSSQSAFSRLVSVGSSTASGIANGFSAGISSVVNAASSAAGGVSNAFSAMGANVSANFSELQSSANSALDRISGFAKGAAGATAGLLGLAGAGTIMSNAFAKNTSIEDTTAALTVMMGSAGSAQGVMEDLAESNQSTPYAFDAWAGAGKTLIAFGQDASKVSDTVTALGEAASATGKGTEALDSMSTAFGQALASGKVSMETMNQLAAGGVNGLAILANQAGVSTEEMQKMISSGAVPAADAIDTLTKGIMEGTDGIAGHTQALEGTMGAMSQTTSGVLTNLGAAFNNLGSTVLDLVFPAIKVVGQAMTDFVYAAQDVVKNLQAGEGVWGVARLGILGIATAATVWAIPAIAALATAIISRLGGSAILKAIKTANGFWFAAGGEGKTMGVITKIWTVASEWTRSAAVAVVQGAKAGTAWLLAAPKNLRAFSVAFGAMVAGWGRAAGAATVNAAKFAAGWVVGSGAAVVNAAKIAGAWIIAAPKNPLVWVRAFGVMVAGWARAALAATVNAGKIALAWVLAAPKSIGVGIAALATMAAGWVRAGVAAMVNGAKIAIGWMLALGPIGLVIGAVAGVVALFVTLWNRVEGFRNFFIGIWDGIVAVVTWAWNMIRDTAINAWNGLTSWFQGGGASGVWDSIKDGAQAAWDFMKMIWDGAVDFFGGVFGYLADFVTGAWEGITNAFLWAWETVLQPIYNWISETWGKIWEVIGPAWDTVSQKLGEFGVWFSGFWNETIWPLLSKVIDFFKMLGDAIGGFIAEHWEKFKWVLIVLGTVLLTPIVIGMGLVVAAIAAVVLIVGVVVGAITGFVYLLVKLPGWIAGVVSAVGDWFARMWQKVKDAFSRAGAAVSDWWENSVKTLPGKIGGAISSVGDWFRKLPGVIWDAVKGAGKWLLNTGGDIIAGLKQGLENKVKDIGAWFLDKLPGFIRKPFEKVMGIHSPSRVFAAYGVNIGQGLINGMSSMSGQVKSASEGMAGAAKDIDLPDLTANATVQAVATPVVAAPSAGLSGATGADSGVADPAALASSAEVANQAFTTSALSMQNTALTTLTPMWSQQSMDMTNWGTTAAMQASAMVNPALASTGLAATTMNLTQWQPAMLGIRTGMDATALNARTQTSAVLNPALSSVGATAWNVLNTGVNPALSGMRGAVANTAASFGMAANNIRTQWNQVKAATADPARYAINTVFNDGIVGMWNSVSELLGTKQMSRYVAHFATGGYVRGPGGPTADKVPAMLSNKEFVINAKATKALGPDNLAALNSGRYGVYKGAMSDPRERKAMLNDRTFKNIASRYQGGGLAVGTPAYKSLLRGYNWARSRNGRPYVWGGSANGSGGTDCSGFMSGIADVVTRNGSGARQWATGNFPGTQAGAWKNGLSSGFSVGIVNGGPWGGHTAGTIGGVQGMPAVNVEAGGANSRVKFGTSDAAGANDPQFATRHSLIYTGDGKFLPGSGSGASMGDIVGGIMAPFRDKMKKGASAWASRAGEVNKVPSAVADKLGGAAEKKIQKLADEMMADPGGAGVERWRPMARRSMARTGFDWRNAAQLNAMMSQIGSESGGDPGVMQNGYVDVNTGGNEAVGLLQIIPGTFAAHRDPALPNDRRNPFANMVAALRYYKSKYGMDLTTMWGHGHGYHNGGLMGEGQGTFQKTAKEPERVLSPRQTQSFEELVGFLSGSGWNNFLTGTGAGSSGTGAGAVGRTVRVAEVSNHFHGPVGTTEAADDITDIIADKAW